MYRNALSLLIALTISAFSSQALASLLELHFSGQFAPCGASNLPPPCGAYSGTFVIDTSVVASSEDPGVSAIYPLQSGSATLNQPTTVMSGGAVVGIYNDVSDVLSFYVAGPAGEFKIFLTAAASTINDYQLTEANVLALIDSAPSWQAYLKYSPPQGGGPAFADAIAFNIETIGVPEPASIALSGVGLVCLALARRHKSK